MQNRLRSTLAAIHRYCGLLMAAFIVIAGLTGSVLAFYVDFDRLLNPELFLVEELGPALPITELTRKIEMAFPQAKTSSLRIGRQPGDAVLGWITPRIDPASGKPFVLAENQVFVHPVSGEILGARRFGTISLEKKDLIPFLYHLHYKLHMPEKSGMWLMGGVAVLLMLNCLIALYLAIPPNGSPWQAFGIRWHGPAGRFNFDLHRAGGLWLWLLLFMLAFTGVYLNLRVEVFSPIVEAFSPISKDPQQRARTLPQPLERPVVDWDRAQRLAQAAIQQHGGSETQADSISLDYKKGIYRIRFHSSRDLAYYGDTRVYIDASNGENKGILRTGDGTAGDTLLAWQFPLHSGQAFGLTGRIVMFFAGLLIALLPVTGIIMWWRRTK